MPSCTKTAATGHPSPPQEGERSTHRTGNRDSTHDLQSRLTDCLIANARRGTGYRTVFKVAVARSGQYPLWCSADFGHQRLDGISEIANGAKPVKLQVGPSAQHGFHLRDVPSNLVALLRRMPVRVVRSEGDSFEQHIDGCA